VTGARVLAFAAAGAGVAGAWELLAAVERVRLANWLGRLLAPLHRAAREGRAPTTTEQRRLAILAAGSLLAAGWLLSGLLLGALTATAGPTVVVVVVRKRRERYVAAVRTGAAPAARAMAASLAAGRSVRTAIADAATDLPGAAGHELRMAAHALAIGEPTDAVLERLRKRAGGGPWDTLVAALLLQRDAGGDLAGLLRGLAQSLEASARAESDARAATAQSRATAGIVTGLPAAAAALAELASPGFLKSLLTNPISLALTLSALTLQAIAILCVKRLAR
jgi:tight adherence protein B